MPDEDDEDITLAWSERPSPQVCRHLDLARWYLRKERTHCGECHEDITDRVEAILLGTK